MDNNNDDPPSADGGSRRRRRKKNNHSMTGRRRRGEISCFSSIEIQVDSYLDFGPTCSRKRRMVGYGGSGDPLPRSTPRENGDVNVADHSVDEKYSNSQDVSRAPPMLLHFREIGLSRRRFFVDGNGRSSSWRSMMLCQAFSSPSQSRRGEADSSIGRYPNLSETRLRYPFHSSTTTDSRRNALQCSSPTYYDTFDEKDKHDENPDDIEGRVQSHRKSWRLYARQSIPFSTLQTPLSDAVLAVDRWGGYSIAVGIGGGTSKHRPAKLKGLRSHLSINFYGIPSPARLDRIKSPAPCYTDAARAWAVSPLVRTVPLLLKNLSSVTNNRIFLGHNEHSSPVLENSIQILLSSDGLLGVAFIRHFVAADAWSNDDSSTFSESPTLQMEDVLGTICVFEPPGAVRGVSSTLTESIRCDNVRLGGWSSFTMRNLLWPCSIIPTRKCGEKYNLRKVLSAYMLFNDEDDGFRISWITIGGAFDESEDAYAAGACTSPKSIRPSRTDIVLVSEGNVWEKSLYDTETGHCAGGDSKEMATGLNIAHEVYLHADALLSDILSRRQLSLFQKSPYHNCSVTFMPDFFYNLVSASPDEFKVVLCITFSNREKMMHSNTKNAPMALGVFVQFDILDHSYDELRWVQHPSCANTHALRRWCNSLTLNWRMRERRVGVFCLRNDARDQWMEQWVGTTHECNVDEDLLDDVNINLWGDYAERKRRAVGERDATGAALSKEHQRRMFECVPKDVSMSSLYPHCDIVSNRAVQNALPVKRIPSRGSPIELIYG